MLEMDHLKQNTPKLYLTLVEINAFIINISLKSSAILYKSFHRACHILCEAKCNDALEFRPK